MRTICMFFFNSLYTKNAGKTWANCCDYRTGVNNDHGILRLSDLPCLKTIFIKLANSQEAYASQRTGVVVGLDNYLSPILCQAIM